MNNEIEKLIDKALEKKFNDYSKVKQIKEKMKSNSKKYYEVHKKEINEKHKQKRSDYYEKNKEVIRQRSRDYYYKNKNKDNLKNNSIDKAEVKNVSTSDAHVSNKTDA